MNLPTTWACAAVAACCLLARQPVLADPVAPNDPAGRAALARSMKQHPPGEKEIGAPLYPGSVFDPACSTDYSWERRSYQIVGWCFKVKAEAQTLKQFIKGPGRPYGPDVILFGDGLLYQTDPKRQAFFAAFPKEEPSDADLVVRRHPEAHYSRTCSAERSWDLIVHSRTDRWAHAWCFVIEQKLVDARRFYKFGELSDQRAGALVTVNQVLDEPPLTEIEYLIPIR